MIVRIALEKIFPNPFQPRKRLVISEETGAEFGQSILRAGLISTPVARKTPGNEDSYQIGDGYLRLLGFRWLLSHDHPEYNEMPLDVRELTDRQMADMVLEANEVRKNLTPIDKAYFYKEYLEKFSITQAELAKRHNLTQGEIANTIRLLQLPDDIQEKIIAREISETHARILIALKDWPGLLQEMVKKITATDMTTAALEEEVRQILNRQKKTRVPEPPKQEPKLVEKPVVTTMPPLTELKPETQQAVVNMAEKAAEQLKEKVEAPSKPPENITNNIPPKVQTEAKPIVETGKKPEISAPIKLAIPCKWKRKLALEESDNGVRVSLMSEKGFVVKNLIGNLETTLEQMPEILSDATRQWLEKERK